jgi:hypothetical protein
MVFGPSIGQLARLFDAFRRSRDWQNTVIVVVGGSPDWRFVQGAARARVDDASSTPSCLAFDSNGSIIWRCELGFGVLVRPAERHERY